MKDSNDCFKEWFFTAIGATIGTLLTLACVALVILLFYLIVRG